MRSAPVVALAFLSAALITAVSACGGGGITDPGGGGGGPINASPVIASANPDLTMLGGINYNYDSTKGGTAFTDPNGDTLSYAVVIQPQGSGLLSSGGSILGVPSVAGTYAVAVTASDGRGGIVTDSFTISVPAPAALPTAGPIPTMPAIPYTYADADVGLPFYYTSNNLPAEYGNVLQTDTVPVSNPITNAGANLGRVLFYDKRLSQNDTVSCASCHDQAIAFADARPKSVGFQGGMTGRHAPGLANVRYYVRHRAFWDESAADLEMLALIPIQDPVEMGMTLTALVPKLQATSYYPSLFQAAYGSANVTSDGIAKAIAQFLRSMTNQDSKYDQALKTGSATQSPSFAGVFTTQEDQGRQLFFGAARPGKPALPCSTCHGTAAIVSNNVRNNGLDTVALLDDGAGGARFKAPSLRNVTLTAPYMHDARFATLRNVIDHYNSGIQPHAQLDVLLKDGTGNPLMFNMTETEKQALEAFLATLTDNTFITDPRFANPFN